MNRILACCLLAAAMQPPLPALAQAPAGSVFREACPHCGVVSSVKRVEAEQPATRERELPAGLVANVPLGSGGGHPTVGSATDLRREQKPPGVTYEIVVRLDDGRYQLVRQDDPHGLREGDKVRIDNGRVVLRER